MGRLIHSAGSRTDEDLARRVALEIHAEVLAPAFRDCADTINYKIEVFHPPILEALS